MNKQFSLFENVVERLASTAYRFSKETDFDAAVAQSTRKHGQPLKPRQGFKGHCSFGTERKQTELLLLWRPAPPYKDAKLDYYEVKPKHYEAVRKWLLDAGYRIIEGPTVDPELEDFKTGVRGKETTRVLFEDSDGNQYGVIINPPWPRFTTRQHSTSSGSKLLAFLVGLAAGGALWALLSEKERHERPSELP